MTPSKPGIPLNEPQTEAGRALLADMRRDESVLAGMAVSPGIRFGPQFFEALESAILAIEREARGIPLIDVELLARALANTGQAENYDGTRWNPTTVRIVTESIAAEYTRLASEEGK